jgi:hypothetical protein
MLQVAWNFNEKACKPRQKPYIAVMTQLEALKKRLRPGQVYRREDVARWSKAVDRHLKQLVQEGTLAKLAGGLYERPQQTAFGAAPADDAKLVQKFLKDDDFVLASPNAYNRLGVGTTQLYDKTVVYNRKRHGVFAMGGRTFDFRVKPSFPKKLSKEFLLVDLVNNLDRVAEDCDAVLTRVKEQAQTYDGAKLQRTAQQYGKVGTKKFFDHVLAHAG